ncbi:hypothetical protein DFH09DRAFT_1280484 [Mycena vulgaris]|nr:hypothetical protein DFH09DRAFT_1280484 [Mycena vulgaris]
MMLTLNRYVQHADRRSLPKPLLQPALALSWLVEATREYGNICTFILLGRKVVVTLSAKGNKFVLGGKSTTFNAEGAYKKSFLKVGLSTEDFRAYVGSRMIEEEVEEFLKTDGETSTLLLLRRKSPS